MNKADREVVNELLQEQLKLCREYEQRIIAIEDRLDELKSLTQIQYELDGVIFSLRADVDKLQETAQQPIVVRRGIDNLGGKDE